jgi:hypothetical protein
MRGRVHTTFGEGKCHPILLSESLWEIMRIDPAVGNSRQAKGFTKVASPSSDASIIGVVPGSTLSIITSSSTLSSTGLDAVRLNTP